MAFEDVYKSLKIKQDLRVQGDLTVLGDFVFGDAATDSLTITGLFVQTNSGTVDAHLVTGTGDLAATEDLVRFSSTGNISSTSNVLAIEQTTGAGTAGAYGLYVNCTGTNVEAIKVDAGKVVFDETLEVTGIATFTAKVELGLNGGTASSSGLLMGVGTTASPATSSTADDKFVELRCESTATSGDNRLSYMRYALSGTGGGGECIRAFTKLAAAVGTARGAHISLDIDDSPTGSVTGLGIGVDAQLLIGNGALPSGGTYAALQAQIYSGGSSSDIVAATEVSFLSLSNSGNSTGKGKVDTTAFLLSLQGFTANTGKLLELGTGMGTVTGTLKIKIGADTRFIPFYSSAA